MTRQAARGALNLLARGWIGLPWCPWCGAYVPRACACDWGSKPRARPRTATIKAGTESQRDPYAEIASALEVLR